MWFSYRLDNDGESQTTGIAQLLSAQALMDDGGAAVVVTLDLAQSQATDMLANGHPTNSSVTVSDISRRTWTAAASISNSWRR